MWVTWDMRNDRPQLSGGPSVQGAGPAHLGAPPTGLPALWSTLPVPVVQLVTCHCQLSPVVANNEKLRVLHEMAPGSRRTLGLTSAFMPPPPIALGSSAVHSWPPVCARHIAQHAVYQPSSKAARGAEQRGSGQLSCIKKIFRRP